MPKPKSITDSCRNALSVLLKAEPRGLTAKDFGRAAWPNAAHNRVNRCGNKGSTRGLAVWCAAGGYLSKLEKKGYVRRIYEGRYGRRWRISQLGKEELLKESTTRPNSKNVEDLGRI